MLGLWGEGLGYQLPARLPDLPDALPDDPTLEQRAVTERLDLQIVKLDTETLARQLGLTKTTRFINVLEVGPVRVLEGPRDAPFKTGYEIAFELPLFDWGGARVAGARARYERQLNLAAQAAIDARAEVRQAAHQQRLQFDIARHYRDEILPLARRISEENLLRYNAMLIDTLTLLTDTRSQIASMNAAIDARRDYWLAQADLDMALIGQAELSTATATSLGAPAAAVAATSVSRVALSALPEPVIQTSATTTPPKAPATGRPFNPVVTLNGWSAPRRMHNGVKEFHLVADPVQRELTPGCVANLWGYNGQSPGPTIEVVEGERVRIFVTNKLSEHTSVHWHGQRRAKPLCMNSSPDGPAHSCITRTPMR